ncbi:MAG: pyruvate kinase [Halothiobacillus sp.]
MPDSSPTQNLATQLLKQIEALHEAGLALEHRMIAELAHIHPNHCDSARNLLHYLGVRQHDIRLLQRELALLGLSSFGVLESHVHASLTTVSQRLEEMRGDPIRPITIQNMNFQTGFARLQEHARTLLGQTPEHRDVRIMVTLPSEAATDTQLIPRLIEAGMDIARINCAHDDVAAWRSMIAQVRHAALTEGRSCLVQIDLAGPKSRTGDLYAQGQVLKIRPERNFQGQVIQEAMLWITTVPLTPNPFNAPGLRLEPNNAPVDWMQLDITSTVTFEDARGQVAAGRVIESRVDGLLLGFKHTLYILEATPIHFTAQPNFDGRLIGTPRIPEDIRLKVGETLCLTRAPLPGHAAQIAADGHVIQPAQLHCTLDAAFTDVRPDQSVWLDDGRIGGLILSNDGQAIRVSITHAAPEGSKIKAEKGINFPDTDFHTPALTEKDLADLAALAQEVDIVALSFLRTPDDVTQLQTELARLNAEQLGVVLKIENRQAFANLPRILLTGMRSPKLGVMIARGDLAVEIGYERLSEVQEEILWLCEAAHVPVVWATQILESMAKSGVPTRPEVTDAAMSIRAECAMLNKGPHITEALAFLTAVLGRMEGHYSKRMAMRRKLTIADLTP